MALSFTHNFASDLLSVMQDGKIHPAFILPQTSLTVDAFRNLVISYALQMQERGVKSGSLVALMKFDHVSYIAMQLASSLNGAASIHWTQTAQASSDLKVTHLFHGSYDIHSTHPNVYRVSAEWQNIPDGFANISYKDFPSFSNPEASAIYLESSGTTGNPKIIRYTAERFAKALNTAIPFYQPFDRTLLLPPPQAILSIVAAFTVLFCSKSIMVGQGMNSSRTETVDHVVGSPRQVIKFIENKEFFKNGLVSLATLAGASVSTRERIQLLKNFRKIRIIFASTEIGSRIAFNDIDTSNVDDQSVGTILPTVNLEIVDHDGRTLSAGNVGNIRIAMPDSQELYVGEADYNAGSIQEGWYYTGDLGYVSEAGRLFISGRSDDRLNLGGTKINAALVDLKYMEIDGVDFCGYFIWEDPASREQMFAIALVLTDGANQEDVLKTSESVIFEAFGAIYVPKKVFFLESLPCNENGKLKRNELQKYVETY